jgi:hypothetical protein
METFQLVAQRPAASKAAAASNQARKQASRQASSTKQRPSLHNDKQRFWGRASLPHTLQTTAKGHPRIVNPNVCLVSILYFLNLSASPLPSVSVSALRRQ